MMSLWHGRAHAAAVRWLCNVTGGAQLKGAHEVLIQNCVIERCNMPGIGVGLDSFW